MTVRSDDGTRMLDAEEAAEVRRTYLAENKERHQLSYRDLAERFGCSVYAVRKAVRGGEAPREESGRRSGEKRGYKSQRELLETLLQAQVTDADKRRLLEEMGAETTYAALMLATMVRRAAEKGDLESLKFIRDTMGEKAAAGERGGDGTALRRLGLAAMSDEELAALAEGGEKMS